ncbi:Tyrosine-protein phosphatase [Mixta theicola]|nr:Tyrosine-protein phosphatase [Mixta theicola]
MIRYIPIPVSLISVIISGALNAAPVNTPIFKGVDNFRDIAGTTSVYETRGGGLMRSGVFYRSSALTLTEADKAAFGSLGITNIYDLRTLKEIAKTPNTKIDGADYTHINVIMAVLGRDDESLPVAMPQSGEETKSLMLQANIAFAGDTGLHTQFAKLLNSMALTDGAAVFHCTEGKDRTGWISMVLMSIAGADDSAIMADYLASNDYSREHIEATIARLPPPLAEIYTPFLYADASYLQAGLDEVARLYGSVDNYIREGLGLSQETIYVLRGRMVQYSQLPGQAALRGNAAQGAALLNALQNSELSGRYTAYNYYLQSAIDSGSLGGVEARIGGQIHADTASYLLRSGARMDRALAPNLDSRQLQNGEGKLWITALNGYTGNEGSDKAASSNEHSTGTLLGYTQRVNARLSGYGALGYSWGSLGSAGAEADANTTMLGAGARYAFEDLSYGPFAAADINAGWVDYSSTRRLGGGLGTAAGDTHGQLFSGALRVGYVSQHEMFSVETSVGARLTHLHMDGFREHGSELALNVDGISENRSSGLANINITFNPYSSGSWTLTPAVSVGYEHSFSAPSAHSRAQLHGYDVDQRSAFNSRDTFNAGANIGVTRGAFSLNLGGQADVAGGNHSHGFSGNLSVAYTF